MGRNKWQRQMQNQNVNQPRVDPPYVTPVVNPPVQPPPVIEPIPSTPDYPFTINPQDLLPNLGDNDEVTVTNVREISDSAQSDESTAVINDDGTITYSPKGTYFENAVVVTVEVLEEGETEPREEDVIFLLPKNIIGDSPEVKTSWEAQGNNGTCAAMAVGGLLKQKGVIDDQ